MPKPTIEFTSLGANYATKSPTRACDKDRTPKSNEFFAFRSPHTGSRTGHLRLSFGSIFPLQCNPAPAVKQKRRSLRSRQRVPIQVQTLFGFRQLEQEQSAGDAKKNKDPKRRLKCFPQGANPKKTLPFWIRSVGC